MAEISFRRIHGRIVPIRKIIGAVAVGIGGAAALKASRKRKNDAVSNPLLKGAAFAAAAAGGVVSGLTLFRSGKTFWGGQAAGFGLDSVSTALNVAAHSGKGHYKDRAKGIAKTELISQALGYGLMGGAILSSSAGRQRAIAFGAKGLNILKRIIP